MAIDYMSYKGGPAPQRPKEELTLKQRIALKRAQEAEKAQFAEFMEGANPTAGMSGGEKFLAGAGQGMANIGRNVASIVGLGDSKEELREKRRLDQALLDTGAGAAGSFVGEMAALAPLGLAGRATVAGVQGAGKALGLSKAAARAGKLGPAATALNRVSMGGRGGKGWAGLGQAAAQGGAAGYITADPEARSDGALSGAVTGAALNKTFGAIGRKIGRGATKTADAQKLEALLEKQLGRKPATLPVAMAAESNISKFPFKSVLTMFPLARGGAKKVAMGAQDDWREAVVRRSFNKKNADKVVAAWKSHGDLNKAVQDVTRGMTKTERFYAAPSRDVLTAATNKLGGAPLTPRALDLAAQKTAKGGTINRPFYDLSEAAQKVFTEGFEESTVAGRRSYNKLLNSLGGKAGGAAAGAAAAINPGLLAGYLGMTAATRAATSAPVQRFVLGGTALNRAAGSLDNTLLADALRNAIAADDGEEK
jgi:hypothetical protein